MAKTTINVKNSGELLNALKAATGGETILLSSGDYGNVAISKFNFSETVTIKSADLINKAEFNNILVRESSNITFDGLKLDMEEPVSWYRAAFFAERNLLNITLKNSDVSGGATPGDSNDTGFFGVSITGGNNILLENNNIHDSNRGSVIGESTNVVVKNNLYDNNLGDHSNYAHNLTNVLVQGNVFKNIDPTNAAKTHQDNIQFWTTNATKDTTNVKIIGNVIFSEDATAHSIFVRGNYNNGFNIKNMEVSDNLIFSNHLHGISLAGVEGGEITHNTVLATGASGNAGLYTPSIGLYGGSKNIEVAYNTGKLSTTLNKAVGNDVHDNIAIQRTDPAAANYYGNVFVNGAVNYQNATPADFLYKKGGLLDLGNGIIVGASDYSTALDFFNISPTAVDDSITLNEDTSAVISVLANDTDPEGKALTVTAITQGANGSVTINSDGTLNYTPVKDYFGADSFTYTVSDGSLTDTATVNVTIVDVAEPESFNGTNQDNTIIGSNAEEKILGSLGNDFISGAGGNDSIHGGMKNDTIYGGDGNDKIYGGGGHDRLYGDNGNDFLAGARGNDTLTGGSGNDTFQFGNLPVQSTITDFTSGEDKIKIHSQVFVSAAELLNNFISYADGDAIITMGSTGGKITLEDIVPSSLGISDFQIS